jgi:hypothetical protein
MQWTGSWNVGAADAFTNMEFPRDKAKASEILRPFVPGHGDTGAPPPNTPLSHLGLGHFPPSLAPQGYDVYVLGVQEGVNDKVFEAFACHTNTYRVPLHCKLYPAKENPGAPAAPRGSESAILSPGPAKKVSSRRLGHAITIQSLIEDKEAGYEPEPVAVSADMLDRVWGRGDGALLTPKFTGIAVFVTRAAAPFVRLLGVYKHSFGASEGSKGGVGVALGIHDCTMAFVNVHMASKRNDVRRAQYCELVDRLGAKLGGRGFGLTEEFHHTVWLGDTNYHCRDVSAAEALAMIKGGRQLELLERYDELLDDKEAELSFYEFHEPRMAPSFLPSYKKHTGKGGKISFAADNVSWPSQLYHTSFKEVFYKGGKTVDRVPSWTDRIQYHSLASRTGQLLPELLDPSRPETSAHNYCAVTDAPGLDISDHSPVYATFTLAVTIPLEECGMRAGGLLNSTMAQGLAAEVERLQMAKGYRNPDAFVGDNDDISPMGPGDAGSRSFANLLGLSSAGAAPPGTPSRNGGAIAAGSTHGLTHVADFSALHPALRPLEVVLSLRHIQVESRKASVAAAASSALGFGGSAAPTMTTPRAVSVLFPLPYEDSDRIPDRQKIVRSGNLFSFGGVGSSENRDSMDVSIPCIVSSAGKLESLHLLVKVSLDDGTKAQCVVCLRDGGFVKAGTHVNTFLQPLIHNGLPLKDSSGRPVLVQFELAMNAYERGGFGSPLPPPGYHLLRQQASALGLQGVIHAASSTLGAATGNNTAGGASGGDMVIGESTSSALHAAGSMMLSPAARLVASQLQLKGLLTEEETEAVVTSDASERKRNLLASNYSSNRSLQYDGAGGATSFLAPGQKGVLTADGRLVLPVKRATSSLNPMTPGGLPAGAAASGGIPVRRSSVASGVGGGLPLRYDSSGTLMSSHTLASAASMSNADPKARAAALVAASSAASPKRDIKPIQRLATGAAPASFMSPGAKPRLSQHPGARSDGAHRVPLGPVLGVDGDADHVNPSVATTIKVSPSASSMGHGQ